MRFVRENHQMPNKKLDCEDVLQMLFADSDSEGEYLTLEMTISRLMLALLIKNLTAVDITTSSVLLNWTNPNGQSSRYRVEYEDKNVIAENTSIKINNLIPGAQYTFRVFAVAADHVTEGRAN